MKSKRTQILIVVLVLGSLFLFPWKLTLALLFAASMLVPAIGIVVGVLADALYGGTPALYTASLLGVLFSLVGFFVQHLIKTRIIE